MPTHVTLSQLPYTGFDYGEPYNSLFWVVLLVWSVVVGLFITAQRHKLATSIAKLSHVFIIERKSVASAVVTQDNINTDQTIRARAGNALQHIKQLRDRRAHLAKRTVEESSERLLRGPHHEAEVLHERIVSAPSAPSAHMAEVQAQTNTVPKTQATSPQPSAHRQQADTRSAVRALVEQELRKTRIGEMPDEFSDEDFSVVDFDGINPDEHPDYALAPTTTTVPEPEQASMSTSPETITQAPYHIEQHHNQQQAINQDTHTTAQPTEQARSTESTEADTQEGTQQYTDTMTLVTDGDIPRIILKREAITQ